MVSKEQKNSGTPSRMSGVLWDTFTGSASYKSVLMRTIHPAFLGRFAWEIFFGGRQLLPHTETRVKWQP